MNVVVIGDALIDEMRDAHGSTDAPGGSALNVAVGLSVLGVRATLVAMFGADADGQKLARYLDTHNVSYLASPAPLGTGRAVSDRAHGEPSYSFTAAQVERTIDFEFAAEAIAEADLVAVSGFPFDNERQVGQLLAATAGKRLLIDPNPRRGLLTDRAAFASGLELLAPGTELVKLGEDDAHLIWHEPLSVVTDLLLDAKVGAVLATAGEAGAAVIWREGEVRQAIPVDPRPIVDTMGAGDATFAAVIAELASSAHPDWQQALGHAMAIAAETIRHRGGLLRLPSSPAVGLP